MYGGAFGVIFDVKEMAVFDGPGIRSTVFFKGCPLRCSWCHNPEGMSPSPQILSNPAACTGCGVCRDTCSHPESCTVCGECVRVCPGHLRRVCGRRVSARELANQLWRDKDFFQKNGGGVTVSGGEPLYQPEFLLELLGCLDGLHRAIETGGYCGGEVFEQAAARCELVMLDIKLADRQLHKRYTGVFNDRILLNLGRLKQGRTPFIVRVPLIPGVSDTRDNIGRTAALLEDAPALERVELLPYHLTAGAKYASAGLIYSPGFDEDAPPQIHTEAFDERGIPWKVLGQ